MKIGVNFVKSVQVTLLGKCTSGIGSFAKPCVKPGWGNLLVIKGCMNYELLLAVHKIQCPLI